MEPKRLLFSNPIFHTGINVTVRSGYKWADSLNEIVEVGDTDGLADLRSAHILGVLTTKLNKIPESILAQEHDPSCRTLDGIITEMKRVYGDIADDAPVTVLFFEFGEVGEEIEIVDTRVDIELDFTDEEFITAAGMAHERDLTLNAFINEVLTDFVAEYEPDLIRIAKEEQENG